MKKLIIAAIATALILGSRFLTVDIVTNGNGYHIENGNKALVIESVLYSDVEPLALFVIE